MTDKIPDPESQAGLMDPKELKGHRDALQTDILHKTHWLAYCCCCGVGVDGLDLPCFFCLGEVCCVGGIVKLTSCYDHDGFAALTSKCLCCITGCEIPPDNTPGVGIGPARMWSNIEDRTIDDCTHIAAKNELDTYKQTFWLWSLYFCFQGLTYDCSPLCEQEGKFCCLALSIGSASCWGDDGCIECSSKCGCVVLDGSIPAGYTPGCVCCTHTFCCEKLPPLDDDDGYHAPLSQQEPEQMRLQEGFTLKVQITSAKGLRAADLGVLHRSSDPYCICTIAGRPETKLKTEIIKKCLEPVWNFEGELTGVLEGDDIEFVVHDYDKMTAADFLGKATLKYQDFAAKGSRARCRLPRVRRRRLRWR